MKQKIFNLDGFEWKWIFKRQFWQLFKDAIQFKVTGKYIQKEYLEGKIIVTIGLKEPSQDLIDQGYRVGHGGTILREKVIYYKLD